MSDPTTVTLTVLTAQARAAEALFFHECSEQHEDTVTTAYVFYEVNYGELTFLPTLRDAGIAYDSEWGSGDEYTAGTASCRFSQAGEIIRKDIYDDAVNPSLTLLIALIDQPVRLRQAILDHQEKVNVPLLEPVQEEYGKLYRAHMLLGLEPTPSQ